MPAQDRVWGDQATATQRSWQPPDERSEHGPVPPLQAGSGVGAAQHRDLVPQHEQLDILGGGRATQQQDQSEKLPKDQVQEPQSHGGDHALTTGASITAVQRQVRRFGTPQDTGDMISDAEVAEIEFTAFASTKTPVIARLLVRRVRDRAKLDELFPLWRHHPFLTNNLEPTAQADITHLHLPERWPWHQAWQRLWTNVADPPQVA